MSQHNEAYLATIKRLEPAITAVDLGVGLASIAISLKKIAANTSKSKFGQFDRAKALTIIDDYLRLAGCIHDWDAEKLLSLLEEISE